MSVIKLQVGLLGSARELQRDLNRMGNTLDTSTPQGLHYLLQETVLALRRNPQYAMYGMPPLHCRPTPLLPHPSHGGRTLDDGGCSL